ncbi:hypothetical protein CPC08DRAFT_753318 [Agrocybe pediades]|nr:hypothetical protein CPC08DRAFT_753318 [Agrocybe pediades]
MTTTARSVFRLLSRINFPSEPPPNSFRLAKLVPKPYTFEQLPPQAVFTAEEDLSIGPYRWSQVYSGSLHNGTSVASMQNSDDVVLKVFKESLFPDGSSFLLAQMARRKGVSPWWNEATAEHMCWTEVLAYSVLYPLQGKTIPEFIDAYMVKSPDSDEECMAIAMTRVKGRPIEEVCLELGADKDPDEEKWYPIAVEMLRNVHSLRQLGLVQMDIRTTNLLVEETDGNTAQRDSSQDSSPSKYRVNMIDFAHTGLWEYKIGDNGCADIGSGIDVAQMEIMIARWCGNEVDHEVGYDLDGPTRRRSEFFKWLLKNHGHEAFVKDYWVSLDRCVYDDYIPFPSEGPDFRP